MQSAKGLVRDLLEGKSWSTTALLDLNTLIDESMNSVVDDVVDKLSGAEPELRAVINPMLPRLHYLPQVSLPQRTLGSTPRLVHMHPVRKSLISALSSWTYDCDELQHITEGKALSTLFYFLIEQNDLLDRLGLDQHKVRRFATELEQGYHANPYHNSVHAACVLQGMHCILMEGGLLDIVVEAGANADLTLLSAYLAAASHDFRHPGVNNDMLVKTHSKLARLYNDRSVSENHHLHECYNLLKLSATAFLEQLDEESWMFVRHLVIGMVLETDMQVHFEALSQFKQSFEPDEKPTRYLQMALKCADVIHTTYPWEKHCSWVNRLEAEGFKQGDAEKQIGIKVSPLMDREKPIMARTQSQFLQIVVEPMLEAFVAHLPKSQPLLTGLVSNIKRWQAEHQTSVV